MMWKWNVNDRPYRDQVDVAALAGCECLSIAHRDYQLNLAKGISARDMRSIAKDRGVVLGMLDAATCWTPIRYPPDKNSFIHERFKLMHDISPTQAFDMCSELGISALLCAPGFEEPTYAITELTDYFREFCDQAALYNIHVGLEPLPMMGLKTVQDAFRIVNDANIANGSIVLDTVHFMRSGDGLDILRAIPRGMIKHVQVADALPRNPAHSSWEDAAYARTAPGKGCLPLDDIIACLLQTQDLESIGLEFYSSEIEALSSADAGHVLNETLSRVLNGATAKVGAT